MIRSDNINAKMRIGLDINSEIENTGDLVVRLPE